MEIKKRKLNRWNKWDYSNGGYYFVTICTENREELFGIIEDGEMQLNKIGYIANNKWQEIKNHYGNIILDEYIVMPNHIHGIIRINNKRIVGIEGMEKRNINVGTADVGTAQCAVRTENNKRYGLLSKIIKSFKEAVSKEIKKEFIGCNFGWHRSFYDRIVRDEKGLENIREYIRNNPGMWGRDRNNLEI